MTCVICGKSHDLGQQLVCIACGDVFCIGCHKSMHGIKPEKHVDPNSIDEPLCKGCALALDG